MRQGCLVPPFLILINMNGTDKLFYQSRRMALQGKAHGSRTGIRCNDGAAVQPQPRYVQHHDEKAFSL